MPKPISRILLICLLIFSFFMYARAQKQVGQAERKALYLEISVQDSLLFTAFNTRDLNWLQTFFTDDLELYQDNVGVRDKKETIEAFAELFRKDYILKRHLVKESMEVYPVKGFGAIQTGAHEFVHMKNGKEEKAVFKFTHIWQKTKKGWKIKRLITYDH